MFKNQQVLEGQKLRVVMTRPQLDAGRDKFCPLCDYNGHIVTVAKDGPDWEGLIDVLLPFPYQIGRDQKTHEPIMRSTMSILCGVLRPVDISPKQRRVGHLERCRQALAAALQAGAPSVAA